MKKSTKTLLIVLLFIFAVGATFCITYLEAGKLHSGGGDAVSAKTAEIAAYLDRYFIDDYDESALADAAASAMVQATGDKWSYYLSADQYDAYAETMSNAYVGIGVTIQVGEDEGGMRIELVTPGSPAEEAGIEAGDIIISGTGADEAAIRDIAERSGTEKLGFRIEAGSGRDCALYITKKVSERASEINDMWIDITQNSSCGCFEDFYESGGLKIYDMMLALNSRYGLHLKIFDMFRMGTPAEIADFIDQTEGI